MLRSILTNSRCFHTSSCWNSKMGRVMKKVLGQTSKKKKIFSERGILPTADDFSKGSTEGKYSGSARRVSVLNKLFMKHITDLLATGEYSSEFTGLGIEINRVQIAPDYKALNVFWVAKGTEEDEITEKLLKKNAGFLRHELSSLRVMGVVPMIQFVKDKRYAQIVELDARLAKADFGEDHVPIEMATKLKTQLELLTSLPPNLKEKLQDLENESEDDEIIEEEMPPMPQDVLGLNHFQILNRIKRSMKKSEATHRYNNEESGLVHTLTENPVEYESNKERREAFKTFLAKRELMRSKEKKAEKNYVPDLEYMKEEFEERRAEHFKNLEVYDEEPDYEYISEDEEEKK